MIVFVRNTGDSRLTCGEIKQYPDSCSRYFETVHCHVSCGSGTNTRASRVKKYSLDILSVKEVDFTNWLCMMHNVTAKSNTVTLKQAGEHYFKSWEVCMVNLVNHIENIASVDSIYN